MNDTLHKANIYFSKIKHNYDRALNHFENQEYDLSRTQLEIFKINLEMLEFLLSEIENHHQD